LGRLFRGARRADPAILDHGRVAFLDLARKRRKKVAQMDPAEIVPLEVEAVHVRRHNARAGRHRRPANGRIVVEERADADDGVGPVDNLACARRADLAPIDSGVLRMVFRKKALGRGHHSHGAAERLRQRHGLLLRACGAQLAANQHHGLLLLAQKRDRCFHRGV